MTQWWGVWFFFLITHCWSVASRNPLVIFPSPNLGWLEHISFSLSPSAFFYYKIHGAIAISKESKLCHCSNCMRKRVLRAGSWLGVIKISLSWFESISWSPVPNAGFSLVLPHFRQINSLQQEWWMGTGEADPLETVRSEVRLPYLEPCAHGFPFSDLLTRIFSCTSFNRGPQLVWGHRCEEGKAGFSAGISFACSLMSSVVCHIIIHLNHTII